MDFLPILPKVERILIEFELDKGEKKILSLLLRSTYVL